MYVLVNKKWIFKVSNRITRESKTFPSGNFVPSLIPKIYCCWVHTVLLHVCEKWIKPRLISHLPAHHCTHIKYTTELYTQSLGTTSTCEKTHICEGRRETTTHTSTVPKPSPIRPLIHPQTIHSSWEATDQVADQASYLEVKTRKTTSSAIWSWKEKETGEEQSSNGVKTKCTSNK